MTTKIISDRCIELSRDRDGFTDIESANILCTLVMLKGSGILDRFEEQGITGAEIKFLSRECGSNSDQLSRIINEGFPQELLAKVKASKYYIKSESEKPSGILKFIRLR